MYEVYIYIYKVIYDLSVELVTFDLVTYDLGLHLDVKSRSQTVTDLSSGCVS